MKVLVTGINGMLGSRIAKTLLIRPDTKVFGTARSALKEIPGVGYEYVDLTDSTATNQMLTRIAPDVIVHCAANVNIANCEEDREAAYAIHVTASETLAAHHPAARFIYISTDSVYDGVKGNFTEQDQTQPVNYYAQTKLLGEQAVLDANKNAVILRINIYGFSDPMKSSLAEWIIKTLGAGETMNGFDDVYFNPLYTGQAAETVSALMENNITGLMNTGCSEHISKYEFAKLIADEFGFSKELIIKKSVEEFPAMSNRPKITTLNTAYLSDATGLSFSVKEGIRNMHDDFKNEMI